MKLMITYNLIDSIWYALANLPGKQSHTSGIVQLQTLGKLSQTLGKPPQTLGKLSQTLGSFHKHWGSYHKPWEAITNLGEGVTDLRSERVEWRERVPGTTFSRWGGGCSVTYKHPVVDLVCGITQSVYIIHSKCIKEGLCTFTILSPDTYVKLY